MPIGVKAKKLCYEDLAYFHPYIIVSVVTLFDYGITLGIKIFVHVQFRFSFVSSHLSLLTFALKIVE